MRHICKDCGQPLRVDQQQQLGDKSAIVMLTCESDMDDCTLAGFTFTEKSYAQFDTLADFHTVGYDVRTTTVYRLAKGK